jgi:hypothetical protein
MRTDGCASDGAKVLSFLTAQYLFNMDTITLFLLSFLIIALGALPGYLLRYLVLSKPLSSGVALTISFLYLIVGLWFVTRVLDVKQPTFFSASVAWVYFTLIQKSKQEASRRLVGENSSKETWELELFYRRADSKEEWKQGVPPGMTVEETCDKIKAICHESKQGEVPARQEPK